MNQHPFIYIASLMRTGSTMLCEALTQLPKSYIFREPHLGKNSLRVRQDDEDLLAPYNISIRQFAKWRLPMSFFIRRLRFMGYAEDFMVAQLKNSLLPQFQASGIKQIGIKEVRNKGWENYVRHFPDMKVIITGRDPRDIYISTYYKNKRTNLDKQNPITPHLIAKQLNQEFHYQQQIKAETDFLPVTYEMLCENSDIWQKILSFVKSPLSEIGELGLFLSARPERINEYHLHQGEITKQSVARWRSETKSQLIEEAHICFDLMPEYTNFWGYKR